MSAMTLTHPVSAASPLVPSFGAPPAIVALENLMADPLKHLPRCETRHTRDSSGGVTLSLYVCGQDEPLMFGSVSLEPGSGRFYRTYETGWPGREKRKERHYFVDVHDAARYLQFLVATGGC